MPQRVRAALTMRGAVAAEVCPPFRERLRVKTRADERCTERDDAENEQEPNEMHAHALALHLLFCGALFRFSVVFDGGCALRGFVNI